MMKGIAIFALACVLAVPAGLAQDNGQLQSAVQRALNSSRFRDVHVAVQGNDVTLTGTVGVYEAKLQADKKARHVHGVAAVDDEIQVAGPEIPDQELQSKLINSVTYGLLGYVPVQFQTIMIGVHNGVVYVSGHAAGPIAATDAMSIIDNTKGVKGVVDHLKVDPLSTIDFQLRMRVYHAVYSSPFLFNYAINPSKPVRIQVENEHVTLYGVVDTETQKEVAGIKANSVPGVLSVTNDIQVLHPSNEKPSK
jgi:osmotically-inducible protein OsmY